MAYFSQVPDVEYLLEIQLLIDLFISPMLMLLFNPGDQQSSGFPFTECATNPVWCEDQLH